MRNRKRGIWLSLQGGLLLICCSLVLGAGSSPGGLIRKLVKQSERGRSIQLQSSVVVSEGLRLEILDTKQHPNDVVEVTLKNGYQKDITAIAATAGDAQSFRGDYIYAEIESGQRLAPGATDMFLYTPTHLHGVLPQVIISAVIFSDNTSKGDSREVSAILEKRVGMKIQLKRIMPYLDRLDRVKNSKKPLISREIGALKSIAEALPIETSDGSPISPDIEYGLKHGRAFILHYLSKLETAVENQRVESFYHNGTLQMREHTGEDEFRSRLPRIQMDFKGLAARL